VQRVFKRMSGSRMAPRCSVIDSGVLDVRLACASCAGWRPADRAPGCLDLLDTLDAVETALGVWESWPGMTVGELAGLLGLDLEGDGGVEDAS